MRRLASVAGRVLRLVPTPLPQGQPERRRRAKNMVAQMDAEAFGGCTNIGECTAACPKEISQDFIARMNRDFVKAKIAE
jgi:succinate dehydrogenase / fumarate reductase iron-sulfur subunit